MTSRQIDIRTDEHFATVLVGIGDSESGQTRRGQRRPPRSLIVSDRGPSTSSPSAASLWDSREPLRMHHGPPGTRINASVFTDGLVERRGEIIDRGLERS